VAHEAIVKRQRANIRLVERPFMKVVATVVTFIALAPIVLGAQEAPRVVTERGGESVVIFRNECRVFYDRDGRYVRRNDNCSRGQQRLADDAIARYRRDNTSNPGPIPPRRPDRDHNGSWNAGSANRVYENIDARASGFGKTDMRGIKGNGNFATVRARLGTGGDAIVDIADPTDGQIRGTVRSVDGQTVRLSVTSVYGYRASGSLTVDLRDATTVRGMSGSGTGERGQWSLRFQVTR
jgi:hypothetical protein